MKKQGFVFVVSGPSGSGKSTLVERLFRDRRFRSRFAKPVSFTTRPRRSGERQAKDYFFISERKFRELLRAKKILEWTRYLRYYYGTPREFVEEQFRRGKHIVLCLDFKGASQIRRILPRNTVTVFILPPSLEALRLRIKERCRRTKEKEIRQRLGLANREMRLAHRYDYHLENKNLGQAVRALKEIILNKIGRKA
ncbi:MAG: guanylate kinase [Candidatus Paceibacterota bacterium]|jgi:guanylate kinase